jgi:hypothetical protein
MAEKWSHWSDAIRRIRTLTGYSVGAAEAELKGALASGHVRHRRILGVFSGPGRGLVKAGNQWVEVPSRMDALTVSEDDVEFWCRRKLGADEAPKGECEVERESPGRVAVAETAVKLSAGEAELELRKKYEVKAKSEGSKPTQDQYYRFGKKLGLRQKQARAAYPRDKLGRPSKM